MLISPLPDSLPILWLSGITKGAAARENQMQEERHVKLLLHRTRGLEGSEI